MRPRIDPEVLASLSPAERVVVAGQLQEVERAFRENPLLGYRPHGQQVVFHSPPHPPLRAFFGGNRSGKTTATMVDSIVQCVDPGVVPEHLVGVRRWVPPVYIRVITPDLTNTLEGVVLQKFREWCPPGQLRGGSVDRAWDKSLRVLRFKNGSWVQFFSNDQDLDKFGGAALHRVVYDEEPRGDVRRESLMRLIDYGGEELFGMTPLNGLSWTYDEIYEPWERGALDPEDGRVVVVDMDDNPHLDEKTKKRVLGGLGVEEREARKSGRFVSLSGLIYSSFSSQKHLLPELKELPENVEVFAGIDPGIRHMCAVVFAFLDEQDRMVVFDEIAASGKTVKQVCQMIRGVCEKWGSRDQLGTWVPLSPAWFVIDPASRNRSNQTGRSDQQEFSDNGVVTIPGQNAVAAGINRVRERLDAVRGSSRGLMVAANCTELRAEFKRYRWTRDQGRAEHEARDTPVKKDDHLLDALRYVVMQRPLKPDPELLPQTLTMKDRLLRASLKNLGRGRQTVDHPSGPGLFY